MLLATELVFFARKFTSADRCNASECCQCRKKCYTHICGGQGGGNMFAWKAGGNFLSHTADDYWLLYVFNLCTLIP